MCHEHSRAETARILETMADLFAWRRRTRLIEAAALLRGAEPQWRPGSSEHAVEGPEGISTLGREPEAA